MDCNGLASEMSVHNRKPKFDGMVCRKENVLSTGHQSTFDDFYSFVSHVALGLLVGRN